MRTPAKISRRPRNHRRRNQDTRVVLDEGLRQRHQSGGRSPQLAFDNQQVAGKRSGTIVLMHPVPFGYDAPDSPAGGRMVVREFMHDPAAHNNSTATLLDDPFFVLKLEQNKKEKLKDNDPITVEASGVVPAHVVIGKILTDGDASLLVLFGELPQRFKTANITKGMTVRRLVDDASRGNRGLGRRRRGNHATADQASGARRLAAAGAHHRSGEGNGDQPRCASRDSGLSEPTAGQRRAGAGREICPPLCRLAKRSPPAHSAARPTCSSGPRKARSERDGQGSSQAERDRVRRVAGSWDQQLHLHPSRVGAARSPRSRTSLEKWRPSTTLPRRQPTQGRQTWMSSGRPTASTPITRRRRQTPHRG